MDTHLSDTMLHLHLTPPGCVKFDRHFKPCRMNGGYQIPGDLSPQTLVPVGPSGRFMIGTRDTDSGTSEGYVTVRNLGICPDRTLEVANY